MPLPKIEHPILECIQPSTNKPIKYRQMLVKEEKILLMAKVSDNIADIYTSIKQVVNNCVLEDKFDVDMIPIFDLEFIFLKIRAASVDNIAKISFKDSEDDKVYDFEINLDEIKVVFPDKIDRVVKVNKQVGFTLNYPNGKQYDNMDFLTEKDRAFELMVIGCIDKIFDGDEIIDPITTPKEELFEFIESLDTKTYDKVRSFLSSVPSISHTLNYKNSLGNKKEIVLNTLTDFFTFR